MKISDKIKLKLYREMLKVRLFEEKICALYGEQEMRCPVHLSIGQEAAAVGMCEALRKEDLIFGNHRSHAHYIAKGGNLNRLFAELYGKAAGCSKGVGGSMHLTDLEVGVVATTPIVGSSIPVAMGAALANKMKRNDLMTVLFLGDAATEEGVFHETINIASLKKLPMIFFCENNLYSVYTHIQKRQPERPLENLALAHNVKSFTVDGNDILETYALAKHAMEYVRRNEAPIMIVANTYRWREHCGVHFDNHIGYRTEGEYLEWKKKCPIQRFETELTSQGVLNSNLQAELVSGLNLEIEGAAAFGKSAPPARMEDILEFLHA